MRAANMARSRARAAGAQFFVVVTHMGITAKDINTGAASGPLIDFANGVVGFDFIHGDHTDFDYVGEHNGALVVENLSRGVKYAQIQFQFNVRTGRVISHSVESRVPRVAGVTPNAAITDLLANYRAQLEPIFKVFIGNSTVFVPRSDSCGTSNGRKCESLVGNVVADGLRAAYGTDFAFFNSGGIRDALTCPVVDNATDFCDPYTPTPYQVERR